MHTQDTIPYLATARQKIRSLRERGAVEFSFQRPEHVDILAPLLAPYFPNVDNAEIGLRELMLNAIEHGNLEIGFDLKTKLQHMNKFMDELERRLHANDFLRRYATIRLEANAENVCATIQDSGLGFDWQPFLAIDERRLELAHGRGIAIAKMLCFDDLDYNETGNIVRASQAA